MASQVWFLMGQTALPDYSSYARQHSQLGQDLHTVLSPNQLVHIKARPITAQGYHKPNHKTMELQRLEAAVYGTGTVGAENV